MNKLAEFDSKYVALLLSIAFTDEILKRSSAHGTESNASGGCYAPLDPVKLNFVQGIASNAKLFMNKSTKLLIKTI